MSLNISTVQVTTVRDIIKLEEKYPK